MQKVASTPSSLAVAHTLALLKDVRTAVFPALRMDFKAAMHKQCLPYSIITMGPYVDFTLSAQKSW